MGSGAACDVAKAKQSILTDERKKDLAVSQNLCLRLPLLHYRGSLEACRKKSLNGVGAEDDTQWLMLDDTRVM